MSSILVVNNEVPAKSVAELLALAKAQLGKLSYASPGVGTPQHIGGELLKSLAGVDIVHVPYRGAVITDVIGGRVTMALQNAGSILPVVRVGTLRAIAVTSLKRWPQMPELPTIAEVRLPRLRGHLLVRAVGAGRRPAPIVGKLHQETMKVAAQADVREKLTQLGLDVVGNPPARSSPRSSRPTPPSTR